MKSAKETRLALGTPLKKTAQSMKSSYFRIDRDLGRQWATIAAILGSIAINSLSNIYPPGGMNVGKLSNTLFASVQIIPANYAFAIWGLIYLGLIAYGIYQLQPKQRHHPRLQRGGYGLVVASIAQCLWIYLFLGRFFGGSVLAMLGILLPLIGLYRCLGIGQTRVSRSERWFLHVPISLYLGWISVATVVNVAIALYSVNWNGWAIAPWLWTVMVMGVAFVIATAVMLQHRDTTYGLVIVWALVAIAIKHSHIPWIAPTAIILAIALLLLMVFLRWKRPKKQNIDIKLGDPSR